jgi:hypothetical protein
MKNKEEEKERKGREAAQTRSTCMSANITTQ